MLAVDESGTGVPFLMLFITDRRTLKRVLPNFRRARNDAPALACYMFDYAMAWVAAAARQTRKKDRLNGLQERSRPECYRAWLLRIFLPHRNRWGGRLERNPNCNVNFSCAASPKRLLVWSFKCEG
jgi:hypothetical protein